MVFAKIFDTHLILEYILTIFQIWIKEAPYIWTRSTHIWLNLMKTRWKPFPQLRYAHEYLKTIYLMSLSLSTFLQDNKTLVERVNAYWDPKSILRCKIHGRAKLHSRRVVLLIFNFVNLHSAEQQSKRMSDCMYYKHYEYLQKSLISNYDIFIW